MSSPILATKLYIPQPRTSLVPRSRLIERLNHSVQSGHRLTLISAPAGFGKTTLMSEWVARCGQPVAWVSLDEGDNDLTRFLSYLVVALQTVVPGIRADTLDGLQASPPPVESILTVLLNELAAAPDLFFLVLDDYHVIESIAVDRALSFLLEHQPPQMHLLIATREDPQLPLPRLRARGQLNELRVRDLRFTQSEAAEFLKQVMGLELTVEDIAALETRTEGWIAGLQLAAISMQGQQDTAGFIASFTGSHHFVLDYLVEEVLERQPESVQAFLMQTAILDRLCGPLCDVVATYSSVPAQEVLEYLEQANLFLVPLDNERRWYRYHHLFSDLLRQRLERSARTLTANGKSDVAALHTRASIWYEENGLELEAFQHAVAAGDVERAARLIDLEGVPLHYRGAAAPVLDWLASLPSTELDAKPALWVTYASALTMVGEPVSSVEEKLQSAEAALQHREADDKAQDLRGQIAAIRAMLAIPQNQVETIIAQSRQALELLHADNLPIRTTMAWTLGFAYQLKGDRAAASQAYFDAIPISKASGNTMMTIAATTCLGQIQESDLQLNLATENYRRVLKEAGDPPLAVACEAYLGLARVLYQWNKLDAAEEHAQQSLRLAQQLSNVDTPAFCHLLLARLQLSKGEVQRAAALVKEAERFVRHNNLAHRLPDVAGVQVLVLLQQSNLAVATQIAENHELPLCRARVSLMQGNPVASLAVLEPLRQQAEVRQWRDEQLQVTLLQALAHQANGDVQDALASLESALLMTEPAGYIRIFVDEGPAMAVLLRESTKRGFYPDYVRQLLEAFGESEGETPATQLLPEPLSERELEVLRLLNTELNGPEIARQLMVSLNTMRTHTKNIYSKLGVNNRRAAVRRGQELNLL